jgi:hypothetical protein
VRIPAIQQARTFTNVETEYIGPAMKWAVTPKWRRRNAFASQRDELHPLLAELGPAK